MPNKKPALGNSLMKLYVLLVQNKIAIHDYQSSAVSK
jgi:hypothetical protein